VRRAGVANALRRLVERANAWPVRISRFAYTDIPGIGTSEVELGSPLTIFTGPNSVGKTTALRALWGTLDGRAAYKSAITRRKLLGGSAACSGTRHGAAFQSQIEFPLGEHIEEPLFPIFHVDPAEVVIETQQKVFNLGSYEDIVNGTNERTLDAGELLEASYLARRDYSEIIIHEVEIDEDTVIPFFSVRYGGVAYDSLNMGAGEFGALFIWWSVARAPKTSIVLLEEPETFLSPLSQESLIDFLVFKTDQRSLCVVATSHSGFLLSALPPPAVKFLQREGPVCRFQAQTPHPTSMAAIGIRPHYDFRAYVEDSAAEIIGRLMLERFDPMLARRCQLASVGGEAQITRALRVNQTNPFGLKFVGWYDGDQTGSIPGDIALMSALLPGNDPIEIVLKNYITNEHQTFGVSLGVDNLHEILHNLEGVNYHDWLPELAQALGRDSRALLVSMFEFWLLVEENSVAAKASFESFRNITIGPLEAVPQ